MDYFGIKYVGKEHPDHLIGKLEAKYSKMKTDWTGSLYCGITLEWNYEQRWVDHWMPDYVMKRLVKFGHEPPKRR